MVRTYEEQISINAPADKVYAYVSDFTKHGEWAGHGLSVEKDTDGPVKVGDTFSTTASQFGTQREHSTITDMEPNTKFAWDSKGSLGTAHHWFAISDGGGTTTLTKGAEFTDPSTLGKMMSWKLSRDVPKGFRGDLANIKAKLESPNG
jgi:uncharacterized membrane protein